MAASFWIFSPWVAGDELEGALWLWGRAPAWGSSSSSSFSALPCCTGEFHSQLSPQEAKIRNTDQGGGMGGKGLCWQ